MTDEITIDPAPEKTISVLIVDDDDLFLRFCNRMLEREQFTVATAAHGQEALAMAADNVYDVILMDINMPHMSGLACLEKLKKGPSSAEVIIVTGRTDLADGGRGDEAGRGFRPLPGSPSASGSTPAGYRRGPNCSKRPN